MNPYTPPLTDVTKPVPVESSEDTGPDYFWKIYIGGLLMCGALVVIVMLVLWAF